MSNDIYNFEQLLRRAAELSAEVRLVPMINEHYGDVEFYAHIQGHDSETVDMSICKRSDFLKLNRGASGIRGDEALALNEKVATPKTLSEKSAM